MFIKIIRLSVICFFLAISGKNLLTGSREYGNIRWTPDEVQEPGREYADIPRFLGNERAVGYFTDFDLSSESLDTKNFLAAQYKLAPVALKVDDAHHRFIVIDASDPFVAFNLAEKLKAVPVYFNPYGIVLAQKQTP